MTPAGHPGHTADSADLAGWRYGLLGLPLAFVAVPLYVHLPHFYAQTHGLPLAWLGALLLGSRALDALIDPALGRAVDRLHARSPQAVLRVSALTAGVLALGLASLFMPPASLGSPAALAAWAGAWLLLSCAAASLLAMAHQSWGTRLGGNAVQRSRVVAWREGLGLLGVLLAAVLPSVAGLSALPAVCAVLLAAGWAAWWRAPRPPAPLTAPTLSDWRRPWRQAGFRRLLGVFALNGIASAIPATLVLFFIEDRLAAPEPWPGLLLGAYFASAALALPLWLRAVRRWGLARSWALGMGLSITAFAGTATLGTGDAPLFALICVAAGAGLGADLVLPGALLTGVIDEAGDRGHHDGSYLGWWQVATKLNLALAAGTVLPALALWGYTPGQSDPAGLHALSVAYALLPCALKALAALALVLTLLPRAPAQEPAP